MSATEAPTATLAVGTHKQLFLDDRLVEHSEGVRKTVHRPRRDGEILIAPDQRWEQGAVIGSYASVIKDGGRFRVWYYLASDHLRSVCYAESDDGLTFRKPRLGFHEAGGSRDNNVVIPGPDGGACVWVDPNAPTAERYRSQAKSYPGWPQAPQPTCFRRYASPDGLQWRQLPVSLAGSCDTQSICLWDDRLGRYVLYTRKWFRFEDKHHNYRAVRRLESDDLEHWDGERIVMAADETDLGGHRTATGQPPVDYYGAAVYKYPQAGDLYVMLAQAYWHWQRRPPEERWGESGDPQTAVIERLAPGAFDVRLCWSADGIDFHRPPRREPFLDLGPGGRFDSRMVWAMPDPVAMGDELWLYYAAKNRDHHGFVDPAAPSGLRSGIARAVLRLDGFVSLDAGCRGGEVVTPPLTFAGSRLELNLETGGGGGVRVELQDPHGQPLAGYTAADAIPAWGNSVRLPVAWAQGADTGELAGRPVKLRFLMQDCRLYAFRFVPGSR